MVNKKLNIGRDLKQLLLSGEQATQENLCKALAKMGHQVNQSKISRLLRKVNAIKSKSTTGEMVYRLPHDSTPPLLTTSIKDLILAIVANESTIVIKTSPGSAQLIARFLDYNHSDILGTIAGDDAIFVAPQSIQRINEIRMNIENRLLHSEL